MCLNRRYWRAELSLLPAIIAILFTDMMTPFLRGVAHAADLLDEQSPRNLRGLIVDSFATAPVSLVRRRDSVYQALPGLTVSRTE